MRHLSLGQQLLLFLLALGLLAILYLKFYHSPLPTPKEETYSEIAIEVVGEVHTPGIYLFRNPPTLKEAIDKAGGAKEAFLQENTSLSEFLETGTRVTISREFSSSSVSEQPNRENSDTVRIKLGRMEANKLLVFFILRFEPSVHEDRPVPGIENLFARGSLLIEVEEVDHRRA
jgi:hypothetical protein